MSADAAATRDVRLDLLRGFCIFAMVVDHLGGESWLYFITGGNRYYVSAAEGFVFISGLTVGQAYLRRIQRGGIVEAMMEALRRARTLYLTTVSMTLVFSAFYLYTDIALWVGRDFDLGIADLPELVVAALTLHYTYHGTDILAMYAVFVLLAPICLLLLSTGNWYVVAGISVAWYVAYQVYPEQATFPWYIRNAENFPLAAWQVLFFVGMVLGYHRETIARFLQRWRPAGVLAAMLGLAFTLLLLSIYWSQSTGRVPGNLPIPIFDIQPDVLNESFFKVSLRPWRLAAFAALAIAAYALATYLWRPLKKATSWLLLPFGQRALYSYIMHFFLILIVLNVAPLLLDAESRQLPVEVYDTFMQLLLVAVLWVMVKRRFLFNIVPN